MVLYYFFLQYMYLVFIFCYILQNITNTEQTEKNIKPILCIAIFMLSYSDINSLNQCTPLKFLPEENCRTEIKIHSFFFLH